MIYNKESPETIQLMFNQIAKRYDLTNQVLSFSLHKKWNQFLVQKMLSNSPHSVYLDLCSGTGDIGFEYLKSTRQPTIVHMVDFSSQMLEIAKKKADKNNFSSHDVHFIEADVQALPMSGFFADLATMAYGIRNVQNPLACLQEVFRVLKPGGKFGVLELTRPKNRALRMGHHFYLKRILPLIGRVCTSNEEAYRYLCSSIDHFISPDELSKNFADAGFINIQQYPLTFGTATVFIATKPNIKT